MRAIFGVLALLIVLAVVGSLARKQLSASGAGAGAGSVSARSAEAASQAEVKGIDVSGLSVPQQSKAIQDKVRDDTARALQQGADQTRRAADTD